MHDRLKYVHGYAVIQSSRGSRIALMELSQFDRQRRLTRLRVRRHRINVLDREGRRAESSYERRIHRQNENDLRRSARLTRSRVRAAEIREAETAEQR